MSPTSQQSTCTLTQISKRYGEHAQEVYALKEVSLEIPKGSFSCIQGPSGSGKSTLLHIIGLLDIPSQGNITIAGTPVPPDEEKTRDRLRAQHIGFVFQQFHLMPQLSVYENIALALRIANATPPSKERELIQQALLDVHLQDKSHRYPHELSGGEQQRVAIARAICKTPTLLIADEPTANLDSQTSSAIISLLHHLHLQKNMTILCASHDPILIDSAISRITMCDGSIRES